MYFIYFFCHVFMHCWKNSSGMLFSSVVMAFFIASMPSKQNTGAKSGEYGACFSTVMFYSARNCCMLSTPNPVTFQICPNLPGESLKNCPLLCQANLRSLEQSTDLYPSPSTIPTHFWPQFCSLKISCSWCHLFLLIFEPFMPFKITCLWHCAIIIHLLEISPNRQKI